MGWLGEDLEAVLEREHQLKRLLKEMDGKLDVINTKLDTVLSMLQGPTPVGFGVSEEKGETMNGQFEKDKFGVKKHDTHDGKTATRATLDFVLLDNGTVQFTFTPLDSVGNPTTLPAGTPALTYTSSDPALTVAVSPSDTSGFGLVAIGTPTGLATSIVVTGSTTLAGATSPISGSANPVDIVAGGPTGFSVTES
jgi:hypothetical protein